MPCSLANPIAKMIMYLVLAHILSADFVSPAKQSNPPNVDTYMSISIQRSVPHVMGCNGQCQQSVSGFCGFPKEVCTVATQEDDPCYLQIYHLQLRSNSGLPQRREIDFQPLLMVSTPASSPESWIIDYDSLAFYLLEKGYDVWLASQRGTHTRCQNRNPKDRLFWKFGGNSTNCPSSTAIVWTSDVNPMAAKSYRAGLALSGPTFLSFAVPDHPSFKELGELDFKAAVDYIRCRTQGRKIQFVSYSTSSAVPIILTNRYPEYCKAFSGYYMISPMIYGNNYTSSYPKVFEVGSPGIFSDTSSYVMNREASSIAALAKTKSDIKLDFGADCSDTTSAECQAFFLRMWGGSSEAVNKTKLSHWIERTLVGISVRTIATTLQWTKRGTFTDFDFGCPRLNLRNYNQTTPPVWDMKICPNVRLTVAAWSGDTATDKESIMRFSKDVTCGNSISVEPNKKFGHATFLYGNNLMENFNKKIFEELFADYKDFMLHDSVPIGQLGPQHSRQ